jgi:hypothetical protein
MSTWFMAVDLLPAAARIVEGDKLCVWVLLVVNTRSGEVSVNERMAPMHFR